MQHTVHLISAETCGGLAGRFLFDRPEGYQFRAGQHFTMTLDTAEGPQRRILTIASPPSADHLEICTRLTGSPFKNALLALQSGAAVSISQPSGGLHLAADSATGFLVGGVGVTPARSMIADALSREDSEQLILFYGDRSPECMVFATEFARLAEDIERFTYVPVVEHPGPDWTGEVGFITAEIVRSHVAAPEGVSWIVAGPPMMSQVMGALLDELAVPATSRQEELFTGYGTK